jgi:hypothetical protein
MTPAPSMGPMTLTPFRGVAQSARLVIGLHGK